VREWQRRMSESLKFETALHGHNGWITQLATTAEAPDTFVSASRGTLSRKSKRSGRALSLKSLPWYPNDALHCCSIHFPARRAVSLVQLCPLLRIVHLALHFRLVVLFPFAQTTPWSCGSATQTPTPGTPSAPWSVTPTSCLTSSSPPTVNSPCPAPGIAPSVSGT
jgi:hypothetical protein